MTVALVGAPAFAQSSSLRSNYRVEISRSAGATDGKSAFPLPPGFVDPPDFHPKAIWNEGWICSNNGPAEVTGFRVQCPTSTFLDFHIADCCVDGDHWQLKGKEHDANPNTAVTTSPGLANSFGAPGRVYNYGGTPFNPGIDAYVECSYLHGVNSFTADSFIFFSSNGNCTVTPDASVQRIDRTP